MERLNDTLFLAINASGHPNPWLVALASFLADDIIYGVPLLLAALWLWGKREWRSGLLAAFCAGELALFVNQIIALFWFHPRPMMVPIGHTLLKHAADSSFPSDHVTFLWAVGLSLALETRLRIAGLFLLFLSLVVAWARVHFLSCRPVSTTSRTARSISSLSRPKREYGSRYSPRSSPKLSV